MTKKTVLFVDDEQKILNGLRRMLYPLQNDWNMLFVDSGAKGIEILEQTHVTVLISDMRMPLMNGFELLQTAHQRFPEVIRVMLTGQTDIQTFCEVSTISHYFLWKPTKFEDLKALLDKIRDLDVFIHDEKLLQLLGGITSLPSMPLLFDHLVELVENEETDISKIAEVINKDIAMTAQIFRLVNSTFFSLPRPIETVQEAVSHLGLDILRQLVLGKHFFSRCGEQERATCKLDELWQHSLNTATLAKAIAEDGDESAESSNNAYLAGLLHEFGCLLTEYFPKIYTEVHRGAQQPEGNPAATNPEGVATNYAAIGGYLTALWGLPHTITRAISQQHNILPTPEKCKGSKALESVRHADLICQGDCSLSAQYQEVVVQWQQNLKQQRSGEGSTHSSAEPIDFIPSERLPSLHTATPDVNMPNRLLMPSAQ
ncbi:MAG: HDOD domain-containing protein [Desulfobulbaceae bacterium]|nr:HDOD domain-containing protein [Desulfobulbaceae bacterium]